MDYDQRLPAQRGENDERGPGGTLQQAGKHPGETYSAQPFPDLARIALATFRERQVGKSRVLTRDSPGGFPVLAR